MLFASSTTPYPGRLTKSNASVPFPSTGSSISMMVVTSSGISVTPVTEDSVETSLAELPVELSSVVDDEDDDCSEVFGAGVVTLVPVAVVLFDATVVAEWIPLTRKQQTES